jgi:hypothetical protein
MSLTHSILTSDAPPAIPIPQRPVCGYCAQEVLPSFAVVDGVALCQPNNAYQMDAYQMDCHSLVTIHGQHLFDGRWWDGRWAAQNEPDPYVRSILRSEV